MNICVHLPLLSIFLIIKGHPAKGEKGKVGGGGGGDPVNTEEGTPQFR